MNSVDINHIKSNNIVYALICPDTGMVRYVGQTSRGVTRIRQHAKGMRCSDASREKKRWVQGLLDAGKIFHVRILSQHEGSRELDASEVEWISRFRDLGHPLTNLTTGGCGARGFKQTDLQKQRASEAHKGKPLTPEHRAKLSAAHRGKRLSTEHKRALSRANSKPRGPRTEQTRIKLSVAGGGRPFLDQNGVVYQTQGAAARALSLSQPHIWAVLHGKRKSTGGYVFRFQGGE